MENYFAKLNSINVSAHVEKKGQFSYLSWPFAVAQLRLADSTATWEVKRFQGLPYQRTECGYFVEVAVTVQGITLSQIHPVLDARNEPIEAPNAFDINTSTQRCLVKAIALHGLGLYVYAGEDLPDCNKTPSTTQTPTTPATQAQIKYIERLVEETGSELTKVLSYFGVSSLSELSAQSASRAITSLQNQKQRRAA